jgi:hypothetical protein
MASFANRMKEWQRKHGATYRAHIETQTQVSQMLGAQPGGTNQQSEFDDRARKTKKSLKVVEPPKEPSLRMLPGEDRLFLKLATATKIYTQYELTDEEVQRAEVLMSEYLLEYKSVRVTLF